MCGIFGAINLDSFFNRSDYERFIKLTDLVHYRGPDASGYAAINVKRQTLDCSDMFDVFLGHRRLSIIDLSREANQPFSDGAGLWIIYNGEIFNYIELRDELKSKGYIFKTRSDTEVIIKVYKEYGEAGFTRLNGMWAIAIIDTLNKKIVLSRDRFSIKPLYFIRQDNIFYFASEIKQLLPLARRRDINHSAMSAYLNQGLIDFNDETFYKDIRKVKPKCNLIIRFDTGTSEEQKYWDYELEEELSPKSAIKKFRELFISSVQIRLRSDVKVGGLVSGGLDSSAVTVIANQIQKGAFDTFSVIATDKKFSEEKFVDYLSIKSRIRNKKMYFESHEALKYLPDVIFHSDEPLGSFSAVAHYKVLEKIKKETGLKVILSGQGGDEILMGYLKFFFFNVKKMIRERRLLQAVNQIFQSFIKGTAVWQFNLSEARRYIPFIAGRNDKPYLTMKKIQEPIYEYKDLRKRQISDIDSYSIPNLTHYEDRNSMAHSMEIRLPFLDHRLVNFLTSLSVEMKLNKGWTKYILRAALPELPRAIRWRKDKQGFIIPEVKWLKDQFSNIIQRIFDDSYLDKMGVISDKLFLEYYNRFRNGDRAIWYTDISRIFIAELWARKFLYNIDEELEI